MLNYIYGKLKNWNNPAISMFALVDAQSKVSHKARLSRAVKMVDSTMGDYSYMGNGSWALHADIGKFCSIANEVFIGMASHTMNFISTSPIFTERTNILKQKWIENDMASSYLRTTIGNDVWIGSRVLIKNGVKIGNGAVIGAGAVVTKNVPPYAIVGGVPAQIIRYRFDADTIQKLENSKWWNWDENRIKSHLKLFQIPVKMNVADELMKFGGVK